MNPNGAQNLYSPIPGSDRMGGGYGPSSMNWDLMEDLFTYAIEKFGVDWGDPITRDQASELRAEVVRKHYPDGRRERPDRGIPGTPSAYHVERIQAMFDRWYLYYPWVDEVAVRRAVNYDPAAWGELTARERDAVIDRLARHPDPWESYGMVDVTGGDPRTLREKGQNGEFRPGSTTTRALRWFAQPHKVRRTLFSAVSHRKEKVAAHAS